MGLPKEIAGLVEHFERNRDDYKSGKYNEAQLRQMKYFYGENALRYVRITRHNRRWQYGTGKRASD